MTPCVTKLEIVVLDVHGPRRTRMNETSDPLFFVLGSLFPLVVPCAPRTHKLKMKVICSSLLVLGSLFVVDVHAPRAH